MNIIETDKLTCRFGKITAVNEITLQISAGEVFGLLGPNGAGKTTSVRLLNGILSPSSGSARVLGLDTISQGCEIRRQTGVLTETPSLYERLTAEENLYFFGNLYGVALEKLPGRVEKLLALFELSERARNKTGGYSKGMKQRLALARALLHEPQLLFLDEPTSGLDPEASKQVIDLIEALSREEKRTVVLCTHNLVEAQRLCSRVAIINHGSLVAVGTPQELAAPLWQDIWVDLELRQPAPAAALAALQQLSIVRQVVPDGKLLAVQVNKDESVPAVVAAASSNGAQIMRVNPRQHSLEEIYFALQNGNHSTASK